MESEYKTRIQTLIDDVVEGAFLQNRRDGS